MNFNYLVPKFDCELSNQGVRKQTNNMFKIKKTIGF